jgi:GT2 family glycosyltransferase
MEVLITADGCTDNTVEVVKSELPGAKLIVNRPSVGSIASRARMIVEAAGDLVLTLDDDSYPEQRDCLARFIPLFENNPSLAVLHFPQRTDEYPQTLAQTDFGPERPTRSFANSGAVLRRDVYLRLPGFERRFFHMYEEPDYTLQCLTAGYKVVLTPLVTIRHHFSSRSRDEVQNHHRHSRNELWSTLIRCPLPQMPLLLSYRILSQFRYACKRGAAWIIREPAWWLPALSGVPYCLRKRNPVLWKRYRAWLKLG